MEDPGAVLKTGLRPEPLAADLFIKSWRGRRLNLMLFSCRTSTDYGVSSFQIERFEVQGALAKEDFATRDKSSL